MLLISGCSASSRPRLAADLSPEWVSHDAARLDLAHLVHRDGAAASVFVGATGELACLRLTWRYLRLSCPPRCVLMHLGRAKTQPARTTVK
ncbi:hypothetical protein [Burkholderia gladioli]|uniref:hypothetical protein n=1 Tax=Burkholderia gladioli TaxID=28095 RepID=UPI00163E6C22|nr:hypothetical protein [Burkholderia gladioli]